VSIANIEKHLFVDYRVLMRHTLYIKNESLNNLATEGGILFLSGQLVPGTLLTLWECLKNNLLNDFVSDEADNILDND
jgi:hypothetical protein